MRQCCEVHTVREQQRGAGVLGEAAAKALGGGLPEARVMGAVGVLALLANLACLGLLWRRRGDDINMRSAWLCSLNDVLANLGVLGAGAGVALAGSAWPDILVGVGIAALFLTSAAGVLRWPRPSREEGAKPLTGVGGLEA